MITVTAIPSGNHRYLCADTPWLNPTDEERAPVAALLFQGQAHRESPAPPTALAETIANASTGAQRIVYSC